MRGFTARAEGVQSAAQRNELIKKLAIPPNGNLSNGLMFAEKTFSGGRFRAVVRALSASVGRP